MVTFVNKFKVTGPVERFEEAFAETSAFFCAQPGFVSHRLLRHADDPAAYVNVAEWESREAFQQALRQPDFAPHAAALRELSVSEPNLYTPVMERGPAPAR